jgi:hypothetical protein
MEPLMVFEISSGSIVALIVMLASSAIIVS